MDKVVKIISAIILASMLFSGSVVGCSNGSASSKDSQPENMAPDFRLSDLDGQAVSLSDFRGKPVMLNFWASWCGPCQLEMPFIQEIFEDEYFADRGLVILAINIGDSQATVNKFMEGGGFSFPVLLDTEKDVALEYNIMGIPTTFLIDKEGVIQDVKVGAFSSKAEIEWQLVNSIVSDG